MAAAARWRDLTRRRQRAALTKRVEEINAQFPPPPRATVKDFVDHIDYAVKLIGVEHVGISSDFDGGGGVDGWNGADETFNVTLELVRRGYTEDQIAKIWSGNLLRVMDEVQAVARKLPGSRSRVGTRIRYRSSRRSLQPASDTGYCGHRNSRGASVVFVLQ